MHHRSSTKVYLGCANKLIQDNFRIFPQKSPFCFGTKVASAAATAAGRLRCFVGLHTRGLVRRAIIFEGLYPYLWRYQAAVGAVCFFLGQARYRFTFQVTASRLTGTCARDMWQIRTRAPRPISLRGIHCSSLRKRNGRKGTQVRCHVPRPRSICGK